MITTVIKHWRPCLAEAICLGVFMISACLFGTLLEFPGSTINQAISEPLSRRILMGIAMGITASLIIYSPMGKLSGAHMNPAVTITFFLLKKISLSDAVLYTISQTLGGVSAVYLMGWLLGSALQNTPVNYVVTEPGVFGVSAAFAVEILIAFCMMTVILIVSNNKVWARYTGVIAGLLVMICVILSGPVSGFGMNPARTLASAIPSGSYHSIWIYLTAPFIGMFSSAGIYTVMKHEVVCAKLFHDHNCVCIFRCGFCRHDNP